MFTPAVLPTGEEPLISCRDACWEDIYLPGRDFIIIIALPFLIKADFR